MTDNTTSDNFTSTIIDSLKRVHAMIAAFIENLSTMGDKMDAAYQAYEDTMRRPPVTRLEKRQAFLDYVLSEEESRQDIYGNKPAF